MDQTPRQIRAVAASAARGKSRLEAGAELIAGSAFLLAGGICWIFVGPVPASEKLVSAAVLLLTAGAAIAALLAGRSSLDPRRLLGGVVLVFFVVVPQVQIALSSFTTHHQGTATDAFLGAALLTFTFVASFVWGARIAEKRVYAARRGTSEYARSSAQRARTIVLTYLLVGGVAWAGYFASMGGLLSFLDNVQNKTQLASGLGYLFLLANLFQVGSLLAALHLSAMRPVLPRWIVWAACSASFLLVMLAGSRSRAVMFLLVLAIQSVLVGRRGGHLRWIALGAVGAVAIFAAGQIRSLGVGTGAIFDRDTVVEAMSGGENTRMDRLVTDYGHFDRLSLVYEFVPDRLPLQWGGTLASVLLVPIPRQWFPGKPVGSGPLLANVIRPGAWDLESGWASGVTPTIVGELFLNFWWPGVIVGGVLLGYLALRFHARYVERASGPWDGLKYGVGVVYLLIAGTLGEFYGTVIAFALYAVPIFFAARFACPRLRLTREQRPWASVREVHR